MKTFEERFLSKMGPKDPVTGCIEWTSSLNRYGYGAFWVGGVMVGAHRIAWELKHGQPIPEGACILHECDNRPCCNPDHLLLGTRGDNNSDRSRKGRSSKGERHHMAKLTERDVTKIRRLLSTGETCQMIAGKFGVDRKTISDIKTGKSWQIQTNQLQFSEANTSTTNNKTHTNERYQKRS